MIQSLLNPLFNWIENKAKNKYYAFYLSLFLMLCSWFFVCPRFYMLHDYFPSWQTIMLKSNDLTNSLGHIDPKSWLAKKVFRLTVPFLIRVGHLSPLIVVIIQVILGFLMYFFSYKLTLRILKDAVAATFLTAGIAFLYFGRVAFFDINSVFFDTYAYFFILMALYSRNAFLIFLFSTLAAWTDERAFIALSIVFIFHQLKEKINGKLKIQDFFKWNKHSIASLLAIGFYLVLRLYLAYRYNMHTPNEGANFSTIKTTLPYIPIGIWTFFEGFWIVYLLVLIHSFKSNNYLILLTFVTPLIVLTTVAICVTDATRSGSYLVPMLFVLVCYLKNDMLKEEIRILLFMSFVISFLYPATFVCADWNLIDWYQNSSFYYIYTRLI
jgi:hypothetical protein